MPHLFLPAEHTDDDLVLAAQVAEWLESAELHVAWTPTGGGAPPVVGTLVREPVSPWAEAVSLLARAVAELWVALTHRPARLVPRPSRPAATRPSADRATGEAAA
jgi:hypothetical protein